LAHTALSAAFYSLHKTVENCKMKKFNSAMNILCPEYCYSAMNAPGCW
jgi:hypothetical protein